MAMPVMYVRPMNVRVSGPFMDVAVFMCFRLITFFMEMVVMLVVAVFMAVGHFFMGSPGSHIRAAFG